MILKIKTPTDLIKQNVPRDVIKLYDIQEIALTTGMRGYYVIQQKVREMKGYYDVVLNVPLKSKGEDFASDETKLLCFLVRKLDHAGYFDKVNLSNFSIPPSSGIIISEDYFKKRCSNGTRAIDFGWYEVIYEDDNAARLVLSTGSSQKETSVVKYLDGFLFTR